MVLGINFTEFDTRNGFENCPNLKKVTFPQWDLDVVPTTIPENYKQFYKPFYGSSNI